MLSSQMRVHCGGPDAAQQIDGAPHDPLAAVLHGQCLELQQRLPNILSWEEKFPPIIGDLASGNRIEDVLEGLKSLARLQPLERRIFIARFRSLLEPFVALEALGPFPGERAKVAAQVCEYACLFLQDALPPRKSLCLV